jgi:hypothetical protein
VLLLIVAGGLIRLRSDTCSSVWDTPMHASGAVSCPAHSVNEAHILSKTHRQAAAYAWLMHGNVIVVIL